MLFCKLRNARLVAVSMLMAGLAACAAGPQTELSEHAASQIRTVALLDIAEPPVDQILNRGHSNESHSSSYAQALSDAQVEFSPLLAEAITRQLERSNYRVLSLSPQSPAVGGDRRIDLSAITTDADAILVVRFKGAGYVSSSTTALQPWAIVEVQLFDARTRKALYTRTFNGGDDLDIAGAMRLATNARYQYASPEELAARLDDSVDGIKDAELAIAGAIGQVFAVGTRPVAGYAEQAPAPVAAPEKTAAERDREAAAALAAQWAAAAPPPAPAPVADASTAMSDDGAATTAIEAPSSAAASPAAATSAGAGEPNAELPAADDTTVAADAAQPASPATGATASTAALEPSTPAPAPVTITTPTTADSAAAATVTNDTDDAVAPTAAPASESVTVAPPAPTPAPVAGLILKQRTPVRVSPTTQAKIFVVLPAGASFTRSARVIHNGSGTWCFVKAGEITGWVPIDTTQP